ncbi:MAG: efflux RND transporter periplasmic adaptor subunit, partial [Planctomycetota bacterium]
LDVDDSEIKAPRAGLIQKASVEEGDLISAGGQTLLATIYDDTTIDVWFSVPDRVYLRAVRNTPEGAPPTVGVRTELDDDFPFSGEIEYADPVADELTGTIRIRASVDNPDRTLLGGLFVRVRIPTGQLDEAVLVPEAAVLRDQVGPYVLVVGEGNVVERRNVELGATDAGDVIVTSGLAAEDRLVTRGLLRARPGAPVTPKTEPPSESPTTSPAE